MRLFNYLSKFVSVLILVLLVMNMLTQAVVLKASPLTPDQVKAFQKGARYFNTEADCNTGDATSPSSVKGGVFMIGDSIGQGLQSAGLESKLAAKQLAPFKIDATVGISLNSSISHLDNPDDQTALKSATVAIVELGTNPASTDANFASEVSTMATKIKSINPSVNLFWVNIGSTYSPDIINDRNNILKQASTGNFTLIDWTALGIQLEATKIHPKDSTEYGKLADFIVSSIGTAPTDPTTNGDTSCCANASATVLDGNDNKTKIWNYLVSNMGLNAPQAAGIMGNLQGESHFDPTITNSIGAHGIAQWLGGRRTKLQQLAASKGTNENDLATQLDYLKSELEGPYKASVLDPIKATSDLATVTRIWLEYYEIPCAPPGHACDAEFGVRFPLAQGILADLGSGATGASGGSSSDCSAAGSSGGVPGKGSGPFTTASTSPNWPGLSQMIADVQAVTKDAASVQAFCAKISGCHEHCESAVEQIWLGHRGVYPNPYTANPQPTDAWSVISAAGHAHPGDLHPPIGALLIYKGTALGHIAVYVGDNLVLTTDFGADYHIISAAQIHMTYVGWADPYFKGQLGRP